MPQPIDFQGELGRTTAAERVQSINERLAFLAAIRNTEEVQQESLNLENQVQQTQPQSEQVEQETKRRNPYVGRRKHHHPDEEESESQAATRPAPLLDPEEAQNLDVTI